MSYWKNCVSLFSICTACHIAMMPAEISADQNSIKTSAQTPLQAGSVGLKLVRSPAGMMEMMIINASGYQEVLTFGNFISFSMDAILQKKLDNCNIQQTQPIFIGYEWKNDVLYSFIATADGKKRVFTLANFLDALSTTLANCQEWNKSVQQPPNTAAIMFEKDEDNWQTMIVNMKGGKEKLTMGNLLSVSSEAFQDCAPGVEKDRILQILIDDSNRKDLKVYEVDAYGVKEDFTFDNLSTAVAETLENCSNDNSRPFAKMQPDSIKIKFEKSPNGDLKTYLLTIRGDKVDLNLGTLLASAAQLVPYYEGITDRLVITYSRNQDGTVTAKLTDLNGKQMDLSIENLVKSASTFYDY